MDWLFSKKARIIWTLGGYAVLVDILMVLYKKYRNRSKGAIRDSVFFFSPDANCITHPYGARIACDNPKCSVKSFNKILDTITSAKKSLDVCVYFITNREFADAIIRAFKQNVAVRLITDHDISKENADEVIRLKREGVKLRAKPSSISLMHHKFAIIDKELLISGSANWTASAFHSNYENVFVTSERSIVSNFLKEFERLWLIFDA